MSPSDELADLEAETTDDLFVTFAQCPVGRAARAFKSPGWGSLANGLHLLGQPYFARFIITTTFVRTIPGKEEVILLAAPRFLEVLFTDDMVRKVKKKVTKEGLFRFPLHSVRGPDAFLLRIKPDKVIVRVTAIMSAGQRSPFSAVGALTLGGRVFEESKDIKSKK